MENTPIILKGTAQGILLKPKADSWSEVLSAVTYALHDAEAFFRGGRVILELGAREITEAELLALRALLNTFEMELWVLHSESESMIRLARSHNIRTRLPSDGTPPPMAQPPAESADIEPEGHALFVQRTLRSGQTLRFPGHITILGDVNPGAEVVAGGNIVVWGRIRGMVHAGALGDEQMVVCALDLVPSQLRIAGYISRAPEEHRRKLQPEIAKVKQGSIVAEPWMTRG